MEVAVQTLLDFLVDLVVVETHFQHQFLLVSLELDLLDIQEVLILHLRTLVGVILVVMVKMVLVNHMEEVAVDQQIHAT